jgi:hypothetical protein
MLHSAAMGCVGIIDQSINQWALRGEIFQPLGCGFLRPVFDCAIAFNCLSALDKRVQGVLATLGG